MATREFVFIPDGHILYDPGNGILSRVFPNAGVSPSGTWQPLKTDASGNLYVTGLLSPTSETADLTAVAASTSSVQVLAANTNRRGAIFRNDSTSACWIAYADSASDTLYTEYLEPGSSLSMDPPIYLGAVSAIWQSANGNLVITELT